MAGRPEIDGAWVALSRDSNLRCAWCHTAQTGFRATDDMPFELLQGIVGLASDLGVGNVTLTGGEPTLYPHILDAIRHCKEIGLRVSLPTNGLAFASGDCVERFVGAGVDRVGVSPKAHDRQGHVDATGNECFDDVVRALSVLS